jgi:hypothetical protein
VIGHIIGIGYTASVIGGFVVLMHLEFGREWPSRAAFAVGLAIALLGPVTAIPVTLFALWLLGRFTVAGLREAWRIARPRTGGVNLPRAKAVRR